MKRFLSRAGLVIAGLAAATGAAEESHVRARLVSDAGELQPGESFHLGVLLEPELGWHVYWRNPGEAGLATEIDFKVPEGFEVGELRWPAPVFFEQPGGLAGFGYDASVVLAAEVTAPERLPSATSVSVTASWLACKDVCVLGSAKLKAELPLRGAELESSKKALGTWSEMLPVDVASGRFSLSTTGGPVPETGPVDMVVWLNWTEPPSVVEFFPDPGPALKVGNLRTQTRGSLTRIDIRVSRLKTSGAPAKLLRALIVTEEQGGDRSASITHIEID